MQQVQYVATAGSVKAKRHANRVAKNDQKQQGANLEHANLQPMYANVLPPTMPSPGNLPAALAWLATSQGPSRRECRQHFLTSLLLPLRHAYLARILWPVPEEGCICRSCQSVLNLPVYCMYLLENGSS